MKVVQIQVEDWGVEIEPMLWILPDEAVQVAHAGLESCRSWKPTRGGQQLVSAVCSHRRRLKGILGDSACTHGERHESLQVFSVKFFHLFREMN